MNHILERTIILGLIKSILLLSFLYPYIHFPDHSVNTVVKPELRLNVDVLPSGIRDVLDPWIPVVSVAGL